MKRLVWIFLAVFCTALAQVQPVTLEPTHRKCCCCEGDGSCGMPDCVPPAVARSLPTASRPAGVSLTTTRQATATARRGEEKFFAGFVEATAVPAAPRAPDRVTPAASVPLFAVHCSYLI